MSGFTKLHSSILTSSVLSEALPTRYLWFILLAMADKDGVVDATVPGLARVSGLSVDDCEQALATFLAPDKLSRTKDHEGRRLEIVDGIGWRLINHEKYRYRLSAEERRDYQKRYQRDKRSRQQRAGAASTRAVVAHLRKTGRQDVD
jgi:hypothetical protein